MGYCWTMALANVDGFNHKIIIERENEDLTHFASPSLDTLSFPALVV